MGGELACPSVSIQPGEPQLHRAAEIGMHLRYQEQLSLSCTGSTGVHRASNREKPRGLKPAAQHIETGNAPARRYEYHPPMMAEG